MVTKSQTYNAVTLEVNSLIRIAELFEAKAKEDKSYSQLSFEIDLKNGESFHTNNSSELSTFLSEDLRLVTRLNFRLSSADGSMVFVYSFRQYLARVSAKNRAELVAKHDELKRIIEKQKIIIGCSIALQQCH